MNSGGALLSIQKCLLVNLMLLVNTCAFLAHSSTNCMSSNPPLSVAASESKCSHLGILCLGWLAFTNDREGIGSVSHSLVVEFFTAFLRICSEVDRF